MQFMQMLKASLLPRRSAIATLAMVGVVASVMGIMPVKGAVVSAENCPNPPQTPTFNYWPVTYDSVNTPFCHDFAAIDASPDTNPLQWSNSQADWENGLSLNPGQNGVAGIYIHNGASNNLDPALTTAKNVKIITSTHTEVGTVHPIKVTFTADNAAPYTRTFNVHTPANSKLEVIPNSGFMFDYEGRLILDQQNLNLGNSTFNLGDLDACFEYSLFLTFKFKVVSAASSNTSLSIDKKVKNLTQDPNTSRDAVYSDSVSAKKGEKVGYRIAVTNTGNTVANNVTVTDNGVNGISVDSGSTSVGIADDTVLANSLWQGAIPGTVNIGTLQPGETRIIKYTGTVTTDVCNPLVNTARAVAANTPQVSDSATVNVTGCSTGNPGLTIKKLVKNNAFARSYSEDTDAKRGDSVNFQITITNTGNANLNNAVITDVIPSGLQFDDSVRTDGTSTFANNTLTVNFNSPLTPGQSKTVEFAVIVTASNGTICNVAKAVATGVSQVSDDACVKLGTTPNPNPGHSRIVLSKRAFNDTKNVDATSRDADRGDYITYSLVVSNNGNATERNFVIKDDLSQVLPLADMVSTNGGTVSGNMISYPAMDIKAGETIVKTFKVRIKQTLDRNLAYQLKNTYGNTIVINVPGKFVYVAPKTGSAATSAGLFAGLLTAGFVVARKRNSILKFIFA